MKYAANLTWRITLPIENGYRLFNSSNIVFNRQSGNGFIRELGGSLKTEFVPITLAPTDIFFTGLRNHLKRKFDIETTKNTRFPLSFEFPQCPDPVRVNFNIRLYFPNTMMLAVSMSPFEIEMDKLEGAQLLRSYPQIEAVAQATKSFAESLDVKAEIKPRDIKSIPMVALCTDMRESDFASHFSTESVFYTKLLSRHPPLSAPASKKMVEKNDDHQFSNHVLLIDRQGLLGVFPKSIFEKNSDAKIRFQRTSNQLEFGFAMMSYLDNFSACLSIDGPNALSLHSQMETLIFKPDVAFSQSTSAGLTWKLIRDELKLPDKYLIAKKLLEQ